MDLKKKSQELILQAKKLMQEGNVSAYLQTLMQVQGLRKQMV